MSVCSCGYNEAIGSMECGPRVARKSGRRCDNCGCEVRPGQMCVDSFGLYGDGGGWNVRFHAECFELMKRFADKVCGGEWCSPFDLDEASEHAMALADDPFWRDWLFLYEKTWTFRDQEGPNARR